MRIDEAIAYGANVLKDNEVLQPRRESALLLGLASAKDRAYLFGHPEASLTAAELQSFREFISRRAAHEPFQYISGRQEFFGLDFEVTPDVLIPRPETETIVENSIEILREKSRSEFCEIGIGSGCISVSILHHLHSTRAFGFDISENALHIARRNAEHHMVLDRIQLQLSDVFNSVPHKQFDLVVSNPPYVPSDDVATLQPEVRDFEPATALTDGTDGLSIIRRLIAESPAFLKAGGGLVLEIGFNQSGKVGEMFPGNLWEEVEILPDLQGIPRMVRAVLG